MLPGISKEEYHELVLSVGTHRTNRPLTPVEVADRFARALDADASLEECASAAQLSGPTMVRRFLRLRELTSDVKHLVDWGESGERCISFSSAVEVARLTPEAQGKMAAAILEHELSRQEVVSVRQLWERSDDDFNHCVNRVIKRRPVRRHVEVVMGAVKGKDLQELLEGRSQRARNELLEDVLQSLLQNVDDVSGRLGPASYSIFGPAGTATSLASLDDPEGSISEALRESLDALSGEGEF